MVKRMKNKKEAQENYLEKIPQKKEGLVWNSNDLGNITIELENKGIVNRIFQKILKKPSVSYIHLDEMGDYIWTLTDGEKNILQIGEEVHKRFGEKAEPLYERLAQYFKSLENCGFVEMK